MSLYAGPRGGYFETSDPGEEGYPGKPPRGGIDDSEGRILSILSRGKKVLEIGTGLGISTKYLAQTAASVDTVDPDPWVKSDVSPKLPENVCFHETIPQGSRYDLIFLDGNHAAASVVSDFEACRPLLHETSIVVFHDLFLETVREGIERLRIELDLILETPFRLGIYWPSAPWR